VRLRASRATIAAVCIAAFPAAPPARAQLVPEGSTVMRLIPRGIVNAHLFGLEFRECAGVAFDGARGEFFVCDPKSNRISAFSTNGFARFTIGPGAGLREPRAIAIGKNGDVFAIDATPGRVLRLDYRGDPIGVLDFGSATGTPAALASVAGAPDGSIAVLSSSPAWVRVFGPDLRERLRIDAPPDKSLLHAPTDVALGADGKVYVSDHWAPAIEVFDAKGALVESWGKVGEGSGATDFSLPTGIATDPAGRIYVIDALRQDIRAYESGGHLLGIWGGYGQGLGAVAFPADLVVDPKGEFVVVSEKGGRRAQIFRVEVEPPKPSKPAGSPASDDSPSSKK
jgi:DNA-binding beta-propeller fold protein YncE